MGDERFHAPHSTHILIQINKYFWNLAICKTFGEVPWRILWFTGKAVRDKYVLPDSEIINGQRAEKVSDGVSCVTRPLWNCCFYFKPVILIRLLKWIRRKIFYSQICNVFLVLKWNRFYDISLACFIRMKDQGLS